MIHENPLHGQFFAIDYQLGEKKENYDIKGNFRELRHKEEISLGYGLTRLSWQGVHGIQEFSNQGP